MIIWGPDANGITHCEIRHDMDDCGFANVNPSVTCWPWPSNSSTTSGAGQGGTVNVNGTNIEPAKYVFDQEVKMDPPGNGYDHYFITRKETKAGVSLNIRKISKESNWDAVVCLASESACSDNSRVVSLPTSKSNIMMVGQTKLELKEVQVSQNLYGEILISGDPIEYDED